MSQASIEASIFFVAGIRSGDEPTAIRQRGIVLYGEALLRPGEIPLRANVYSERSKLLRLEWHGPAEAFTSLLQEPFWDHPQGKLRFSLGLARRSPLIALPGASISGAGPQGGTLPTAATGSAIDAFVRIDKGGVANAVVTACGGDKATVAALERLKFLTHRDLRGHDVAMFGDVYVAERRCDGDEPVRWHPIRDAHLLVKQLRIEIDEALASDAVTVNLRVYGSDNVAIHDSVMRWQQGMPRSWTVNLNQDVGSAWLRAWADDGHIVAEDANVLIREIPFAVTMPAESIHLEDKLTAKTRQAVKNRTASTETLDRVSVVSHGTTMRSTVATPHEGAWSSARLSAASQVHRHIRSALDGDAYFEAGADGRAMAILSLADKIASSGGATLVDPYFDIEGGEPLLLRIADLNVPLTVVTWLETVQSAAATALEKWLSQMSVERMLPAQLEVFQLPRKKQPFHDRYLSVGPRDAPTVYQLSNSLSGLAKDYPLLVVRLSAGTAWAVQQNIDEIVAQSQAEGVRLSASPLAPNVSPSARAAAASSAANRSFQRDLFFPGWKALLKLVLDPLDDSDQAWIDAACDVGVMHRHASGVGWQLTGPHEERLRVGLREVLVRGPAQLGLVLHMMGEVDARGVRLDPIDTASLVEKTFGIDVSVRAIGDYLRATFAPPDSIRDRSFVTECLRPSFSRELVEAAFYAWNSRLPQLASFPRRWGREFAFMILGRLAPDAAVQLVEELQDITIVVVAAGLFRDHLGDIGLLARALLSAKSPFLRAFGVQAFSVSRHRAHGANHVVAPDDVRKTVAELRSMEHPSTERLAYLVLWSRDPDEERQRATVDDLFVELTDPAIGEPDQQAALRSCLNQAAHVVPRLFDRLGELPTDAASKMCQSLLAAMPGWLPVSESDGKKRTFYESYLPICRAFATAAGWLSQQTSQAPIQLLRNAMSFDAIKELTQPVSPLMPRPGRLSAVNALGWIALCAILAAKAPGHQADAHQEARDLIGSFSGDLDNDLRSVLTEMLATSSSPKTE